MKGYFLGATIFCVLVLSGVVVVSLVTHENANHHDATGPCSTGSHDQIDTCYSDHLQQAEKDGGVDGAFAYVHSVLAVNANFGVTHIVLHGLGNYVQQTYDDPAKALVSFAQSFPDWRNSFALDGYRHGVLIAFFGHHKDLPVDTLILQSCNAYLRMANPALTATETNASDCFQKLGEDLTNFSHGLGHAFMGLTNDDIGASLKECDKLPTANMQYLCDYGVFMDVTYLYQSFYMPEMAGMEMTKPSMDGSKFADMCNAMEERYKGPCSYLVGRMYFSLPGHEGDFKGTFNECTKLGSQYQIYCVIGVAEVDVSSFFKDDIKGMAKTCLSTNPEYARGCIIGVAWSIPQGGAGFANRNLDFCSVLPSSQKALCTCAASPKMKYSISQCLLDATTTKTFGL